MKKFIVPFLMIVAVSFTATSFAQIKTPAPSPSAKLEQKVGLIDVHVEYSRPSMKDREIFGGLVPFGEAWRTGANKNTILTFTGDVKIQDKELKAGKYALFSIPGKDEWTFMFYTDTENWGVPKELDEEKIALQVTAKPATMDVTFETFLITIGHLRSGSAHLQLIWENTMVSLKLETDTDAAVLSSIKSTMNGPSQADFYAAARYYYDTDKDLKQAANWIAKANENDPKFWMVRYEALIHAKLGDYETAIKHATLSKELATKADNKTYIKNNTESIEKWTAMLKK